MLMILLFTHAALSWELPALLYSSKTCDILDTKSAHTSSGIFGKRCETVWGI